MSIAEDENLDEVRYTNYSSTNQYKHKNSDVFASYTQKSIKTKLCSSSIATVVAKHLNSASNNRLSQKLLHVLFDSGSDGSFINQKWTVFGKNIKIVKPTTWITGAGAINTNLCIISTTIVVAKHSNIDSGKKLS